MFELTISTSLDKQSYITTLYKNLLPEIKNASGVVLKENNDGRTFFTIAVNKEHKDYFLSKIIDHIVFMIIDDYKFNFFKDRLIQENENVIYDSFLKAISIFDADIDRNIILKQLELKDVVLIDSLYHFKLQELKRRWQKTVDIILINQILKSENSMLEILKYLVAMSESGIQKADVVISQKMLKLKHFDKTKNFKNTFSGISSFFAEMIELNPAKIDVKVVDDSDKKIVGMLSKIFYDKINF